jgi:protein-S-isoprenylcysteine O-methyltransferase Ste14
MWALLAIGWAAYLYPYVFRAPHRQRRESITAVGPTRAGLLLETSAVFTAMLAPRRSQREPGTVETVAALAMSGGCAVVAWQSVTHLGRQFRVHAGLYHDHQLVRTGPYAVVRHPIYASLLGMLLATILLRRTRPEWAGASVALFIAGTEIRVRCEDGLLALRFEEEFREYQRSVAAYIPFVR